MQKDYRDVGKRSYKARGCLFMLRKKSQGSWEMKWLEGVDKYQILTTHKEHGISPETLSDLRSSLEVSPFNDSGTMP